MIIEIPEEGDGVRQVLFSTKETARALGLTAETVRRMVRRDALPAYRIGGSLRIAAADIEELLRRSKLK